MPQMKPNKSKIRPSSHVSSKPSECMEEYNGLIEFPTSILDVSRSATELRVGSIRSNWIMVRQKGIRNHLGVWTAPVTLLTLHGTGVVPAACWYMAQRCASGQELGKFIRAIQMDFIISFFFTRKPKYVLYSLRLMLIKKLFLLLRIRQLTFLLPSTVTSPCVCSLLSQMLPRAALPSIFFFPPIFVNSPSLGVDVKREGGVKVAQVASHLLRVSNP